MFEFQINWSDGSGKTHYFCSKNRRESVKTAISWAKLGYEVVAAVKSGDMIVGLPLGSSVAWTEKKWREVCDKMLAVK